MKALLYICSIPILLCAQTQLSPYNMQDIRAMYLKEPKFWEKPYVDANVVWQELEALPSSPPYPSHNPYSHAKVELGKSLFEDPKLSASNQIACASCHDRQLGYSDGRSVSYGHDRQLGKRNAQSVIMAAFGTEKFWDGRAKDLETQALMPILDPKEMAYSPTQAAQKLSKIPDYKKAFKKAFGTDSITPKHIAQAIATYERSLMPKPTRFDKFLKGDAKALNDKELLGLHLFRTKARCMNCHSGVSLSDNKYHNLGLTYYGRKYEDMGRFGVTHNKDDIGRFKTPSLRGVAKSAPYMHNGLFPHLRGVLNAYNAGMFQPKPSKEQKNKFYPKTDTLLQALHLNNEELEALESFLKTL